MPITPSKLISISTSPLAKDELVLTSFRGSESVSELFTYNAQMISETLDVDPTKVLGKAMAVKLLVDTKDYRYFHGVVNSFTSGRIYEGAKTPMRVYDAQIVPGLWFLSLNQNYRVFQEKTLPEIVEQVLKDSPVAVTVKNQLTKSYGKLDLCVQYGESDLQFVSRLMERAGVFYYFSHTDTDHSLQFGDGASKYPAILPNVNVDFDNSGDTASSVNSWRHQQNFVAGNVVVQDYDFTKTNVVEAKTKTVLKLAAQKDHEVYQYPGGFLVAADGKTFSVAKMEQIESQHVVGTGTGSCGGFSAGHKFKFASHENKAEVDAEYALTHVFHECEAALSISGSGRSEWYKNKFTCIPADKISRPAKKTPVPRANSVESAKVVGAKGKEIFTDKYGRVKVQFHWDREGKYDDKSLAWIRVAHGWTGNKFGMQFIPRVGQEVMVTFLGGDPDQPVVSGGFYNSKSLPIYKTPDHNTLSGIKTLTSEKGKTTDFHELRFEDKADKEHIYFHSQGDFARVVEKSDSIEIGYDKSQFDGGEAKLTKIGDQGDQIIKILNSRETTIEQADDKYTLMKGNRITKIDKGNDELTVAAGDRKVKITAGKHSTEAGKEILLKVGSSSIKIDMKGISINGAMKVDIKAGLNMDITGTMTKVTGNGMVTVKGGMVKIN